MCDNNDHFSLNFRSSDYFLNDTRSLIESQINTSTTVRALQNINRHKISDTELVNVSNMDSFSIAPYPDEKEVTKQSITKDSTRRYEIYIVWCKQFVCYVLYGLLQM